MAITLLPTPPSRQDPANFNVRADEFLGALPAFGAEANSLATDVNNKQVTASNAATTATNAVSTATTKAGEAEASADAADLSAQAANTAKLAAEAALGSFDDRYLGAKATVPATDIYGNPLIIGALYFRTTAPVGMKVLTASGWDDAYANLSSKYDKTGGTIDGNVNITGNVGIGTSNPVAKLEVQGDVRITSGALGYGPGAGGTVVQATSKSTGVTLNKVCGQIAMHNEALAGGSSVQFLVYNTFVGFTDEVSVWLVNPVNPSTYDVAVDGLGPGVFVIRLRNNTSTSYSDSVVLGFAVRKGANA